MSRITTIELARESFRFSAAHFTIFSDTERENLHGHNFTVEVLIDAGIGENGITFDYGLAKKHIDKLCRSLHETVLLPDESEHMTIEQADGHVYACFHDERIPFLTRDVTLLPVENITVEELSFYLLDRFVEEFVLDAERDEILGVTLKVFTGPGQGAAAKWKRPR